MKNLLFVFALLFFAPVQNFAIVSHNTETIQKTTETTKKQQKTASNKAQTFLYIALGFVLGGILILKLTPLFAAVCLSIGLIMSIVSLIMLIKESTTK